MLIFIIIIVTIIILLYALTKSMDKQAEKAKREKEIALAKSMAARHNQIIKESLDIISKTKNLSTLVSRFDTILDNVDKIIKLSEQYNYTDLTEPPPHELKNYFLKYRNDKIREFILNQVEFEIDKAKAVTKKSSKISILDKAIVMLLEGKRLIEDTEIRNIFDDKEIEIRQLIENIQNT